MPDHVRQLCQRVGRDLLLLPSVSVLVRDGEGRLLLVRHSDSGLRGLVGGAIEVDERPADARGTGLPSDVPERRRDTYASVVYLARVAGGIERPDGDETAEVGWYRPEDLAGVNLGSFASATLVELGWLRRQDRVR